MIAAIASYLSVRLASRRLTVQLYLREQMPIELRRAAVAEGEDGMEASLRLRPQGGDINAVAAVWEGGEVEERGGPDLSRPLAIAARDVEAGDAHLDDPLPEDTDVTGLAQPGV